jgi:hypothetical protein
VGSTPTVSIFLPGCQPREGRQSQRCQLRLTVAGELGGGVMKSYISTSMSDAVHTLLQFYEIGYEFSLWDLKRDVHKMYPPSKRYHADTVSRRLREFRHGHDYDIICINPNKSRYKKVERKLKKKSGNEKGKVTG